jgi:hypothetical protein
MFSLPYIHIYIYIRQSGSCTLRSGGSSSSSSQPGCGNLDELLDLTRLASLHGVYRAHAGSTLIEIVPHWIFRRLQFVKWAFVGLVYFLLSGRRPQGLATLATDDYYAALLLEEDVLPQRLSVTGEWTLSVQAEDLLLSFSLPIHPSATTAPPPLCSARVASSLTLTYSNYFTATAEKELALFWAVHEGLVNCTLDTLVLSFYIDLGGRRDGGSVDVTMTSSYNTTMPPTPLASNGSSEYEVDKNSFNELHFMNGYSEVDMQVSSEPSTETQA